MNFYHLTIIRSNKYGIFSKTGQIRLGLWEIVLNCPERMTIIGS